jgi:hypothetical protein
MQGREVLCDDKSFEEYKTLRHLAQMGGKRNAYKILVSRPEGKRPLGRPRHR